MARSVYHWIGWLALLACLVALAMGAARGVGASTPDEGSQRPRRIVSLNLCADQLILALADRDQIAGLTVSVRDPSLSAAADEVRGLPVLSGSAEEIVAARPDLVIGAPARSHPAVAFLKAGSYRAVDLMPAESYPEITRSIRDVARAVGHPARGEALIARMNADLRALPKARRPVVAAYYQRRGFLTGTGTLIDDLMKRAGVTNLAGKLGKPPLSRVSLEELAAARPDYLIVDSGTARVADQGTEMLHHPILAGIPRIAIPQAWTVCGGPAYVDAARAISAAVSKR